MLYLWLALIAVFLACVLAVIGGGDWVAGRVAQERGVYERIVGKELYRLFLNVTPQEFVLIHIFITLAGAGIGVLALGGVIGGVGGLVAGFFAPRLWLKREWSARIRQIDEQIEEAMIYMANSFKANPSLPEAMADVTTAMPAPISQELQVMLREYKLGTPLDDCLIRLQQRMPARNLELAISALLVGRTVGGDIPKILEDIGSTIRESYRLERVIDTQTAQGKMQAWVMGSMPAIVVTVFYLMDPELIGPLFNTLTGYLILSVAIVLNIIGVILILKIVNIRV
ncbi:type II secretion system F family protein [Bradymonas sediminis]|uniref:type II secretion system F family protein n=1 Tax=Bradymonas sediminis TaxID=1548548 RepID=UPI00105D4585|nr:type II secretion system F family protein [Bradymonas sediminis]TDP62941.1 type II secretion system protein F (GspF) [Bradymonas sediminis]